MEWIKCSDRLPKKNTDVLVFCGSDNKFEAGIMLADWYEHNGEAVWWCNCHQTDSIKPTHWMSLPQSPK